MKASSAPGPDGIPAYIYKQYAEQLVYPIMKIWGIHTQILWTPKGPKKFF